MPLSFPNQETQECQGLTARPSSYVAVPQEHILVFERQGNRYMHLDLVPAHQIKDAPGGSSSAAERGDKDIGVEDRIGDVNDRKRGIAGCYATCIRYRMREGSVLSQCAGPSRV